MQERERGGDGCLGLIGCLLLPASRREAIVGVDQDWDGIHSCQLTVLLIVMAYSDNSTLSLVD